VKSVTETKEDIYTGNESQYNPFVINKALSFNVDCVMFAQELNKYAAIPKDVQYTFLMEGLVKKRRYGKWVKKDTVSSDIALIKEAFNYGDDKASAVLNIISDKQLLELKELMNKGGKR
jgi:hypothetical protein